MEPKSSGNNSISFSRKLNLILPVISALECTSTEGKQPGPPYEVTVEVGQFGPS